MENINDIYMIKNDSRWNYIVNELFSYYYCHIVTQLNLLLKINIIKMINYGILKVSLEYLEYTIYYSTCIMIIY